MQRDSTICELTFPTAVLAVKLNRKRLVVVLEEQIHIYNISNMKLLLSMDTSPNPSGELSQANLILGVCSLSSLSEECYFVYPSSIRRSPAAPHVPPNVSAVAFSGDVVIYDTIKLKSINVVEAHKSPLSALSLNSQGTMLATASEQGTVIRVFSVPEGARLFQFRRGTYPTQIYSIAFNLASTFLCVSSATETIHLFKLSYERPSPAQRIQSSASAASENSIDAKRSTNSMAGMLRKSSNSLVGAVGGYLPTSFTEMWEPLRDFAFAKLPANGSRSTVAFNGSSSQIIAVTTEGFFFQFDVDLELGGECAVTKQHSLMDAPEE